MNELRNWLDVLIGEWAHDPKYLADCIEKRVEYLTAPAAAWREIDRARNRAMATLEDEIAAVLNSHSAENASDTPDFILAQYLLGCLSAWNTCVRRRETWYGRNTSIPAPAPPSKGEGR